MMTKLLGLGGCFAGLLLACGPDKPPAPQPQPTIAPSPAPEPEPEPEPEPDEGSGAGGGESAEAPKQVKPQPSGRPAILMGPSESISSTFGATPGAVLKLKTSDKNPISLKIPEFALPGGYNIEFKTVAQNPPKKGGLIGDVVRIQTNQGDKVRPDAVSSKGDDFELRWPLYDKMTVNLAIGTAAVDAQGNEGGKITWRVIEPRTVETSFGEAYFDLQTLGPVMYLHATSAAPEG